MESDYRSKTVTGIATDKTKEIREEMGRNGFILAGGMAEHKNTLLRIAHMANINKEELRVLLDNLEGTVAKIGI